MGKRSTPHAARITMEHLFKKIQSFFVAQIGVDEAEVTKEASLQNDLGVYGDDATEFFIAFGKEFNVDVSRFLAADYFRSEGMNIFDVEGEKKPFIVAHLEKAVRAGRLDEEVINSLNDVI